MKSIFILQLLFTMSQIVFGQHLSVSPGSRPFGMNTIDELPDSLIVGNPNGITRMNENGIIRMNGKPIIYIDDKETTNLSWAQYCTEYNTLDSTRLPFYNKEFYQYILSGYDEKTKRYKLSKMRGVESFGQESFGIMPVVGITYDQAVNYTKWRTDQDKRMNKGYDSYNEYSLPSPELYEWLILNFESKDSMDTKGFCKFYYSGKPLNIDSRVDNAPKKSKEYLVWWWKACFGKVPMFGSSYFSDSFGLYDILGNLSEMTSKEGVSKGGSFIHTASECLSGEDIDYSGPQSWLGFRCVMRTVSKTK